MMESKLLQQVGGYISGRWVDHADETFDVINPADGALLAKLPRLTGEAATQAADAAARCLAGQVTSPNQRRDWLNAIAELHEQHVDELARIITLENGKPLVEAKTEVMYAAGFYRVAAEHLYVVEPKVLAQRSRDLKWVTHHRPAGVAALITPWNFPLAMMAKKLSGALAAGCPVVMKPAELTPLSMIALVGLMDEQLDLPAGMVNLVMGDPPAISEAWFDHSAVRVLSFTGSTKVGQHLIGLSANNVTRLSMELGGNAPFLVFADADLKHAAAELMPNKFRCSGQTCVCTNRVYVHEKIADAFANLVVEQVTLLHVGSGMEQGIDIGPLINRTGWNKVASHVDDALQHGATRLLGETPTQPAGDFACFFPPTVLTGLTDVMLISREETFGPVVAIGTFADEQDAIAKANAVEHGLAAYLFTGDAEAAQRVAAALQFGHVAINSGTGPAPEAPFGGMKKSGYGREGGAAGILEFVEEQTVCEG